LCGRFTLRDRLNDLLQQFAVEANADQPLPLFEGRYNIPPTQDVPIVRQLNNKRELAIARWGLIPSWTKDPKKGPLLNNARAETIAEKPSFRSAFKSRRCIIPASGFFEWRTEGKTKLPFYFHHPDGRMLAFAGLWERWKDIDTCSIVTTEANEVMAPIHERMPVILGINDYAEWLDPTSIEPGKLLTPCPADELTCYPVSTIVNNARNNSPECVERLQSNSNVLFD
jgi:putative SOS response-associated peptidase YedK